MKPNVRAEPSIYNIGELLGEGLSSRVYKAIREDSRGHARHDVVLKVLRSETAVHWLRREFETLVRIHSVHCVRVFGWENLECGPALVLEYIEGVSLFEILNNCTLKPAQIDEILYQVQLGLRDLHESHLFHGDLGPRNILIDETGLARLVDFGLPLKNEDDCICGTPAFLAPEIWEGHPAGYEADLFSLGLIREDLRQGYWTKCLNHQDYRQAVFSRAKSEPGLLSRNPRDRRPLKLVANSRVRKELGQIVTAIRRKQEPRVVTQIMSVSGQHTQSIFSKFKRSQWFRLPALGLLASLLLLVVPIASSREDRGADHRPGEIHIRTRRWIRAELNGRDVGYSPVVINELYPGSHRLRWKTSEGEGTIQIQLSPGAILRLGDESFSAIVSGSSVLQSD